MTVGGRELRGVTSAAVPVVLVCVATVVWTIAHQRGLPATRFPAAPAALVTFLTVQIAVPRARWNRERALGPGNVALMLFTLQLVVLPAVLVLQGPSMGALRIMPPDRYINIALLMQALAYVAYAVGLIAARESVRASELAPPANRVARTAAAYIGLGGLGLALAFPSLGELVAYFSGQGDVFTEQGPATLSGAASTFLRPFLAYGFIIVWAVLLSRRRRGRRPAMAEIALVVLAIAASATYGYNRGSVVVPALALYTAYSAFGRRQPPVRIAALLLVLAVAGFAFGQYRSVYTGTEGGRIDAAAAGLDGPGATVLDTLQLYGNGAQFWATVVQDVDTAGLRHGETLVGSVLLPVPVLGRPFRVDSGPKAYNQLIYGESGIEDQILGFGAELYWNFGVPAVILGYLVLGLAVRRLDDLAARARDPLACYSWSYCGIWVALISINSLSVLAQIVVYFFWPVLVMWFLARRIREPISSGSGVAS